MGSLRRGWLTLSLTLLLGAIAAPAAFAGTFTVNTTTDSTDAGGCTSATVCSLRDAVAAANAAAGSTITVPAGHYTLSSGELELTQATTVDGAGAPSTIIDGGGQTRVFAFQPATSTDQLTISGLTVTGGDAAAAATVTDPGDGGGILSLGGLDLEHVAITGNTSVFSGGGVMDGALHTAPTPGPATFNGVTIAHNSVSGGGGNGQGGGVLAATPLTMTNSTVADNTVSDAGANEGGGIVSALAFSNATSLTLVNDTITGNVAAQPVPVPAGDIGGGISGDDLSGGGTVDSAIDATNTIIAGNQADGTEADCALLTSPDAGTSHNIQGDASCGFTDAGSKTTTAIELGPLQDNGGPTDTLLPSASSPAVDAGDNTGCPSTDERGVIRPQGPACDIGAVELAPPTATTGAVTAITTGSAQITGTAANPAVSDGSASFQYGTSAAYGQTAAAGAVPAGSTAAAPTAILAGLTPATVYHYRLVVTTTDGTAAGQDRTFTTSAVPPAPRADVGLTQRASVKRVAVGRTFTYTLRITNHGPSPATAVVVTDPLPGRVRLVTSHHACRGSRRLTCSLGTMADGAARTLRITVRAARTGRVVDTARVTNAVTDPVTGNNHASAAVRITAPATCPAPLVFTTDFDTDDPVSLVQVYIDGRLVRTYHADYRKVTIPAPHNLRSFRARVVFTLNDYEKQYSTLTRSYRNCHAGSTSYRNTQPGPGGEV